MSISYDVFTQILEDLRRRQTQSPDGYTRGDSGIFEAVLEDLRRRKRAAAAPAQDRDFRRVAEEAVRRAREIPRFDVAAPPVPARPSAARVLPRRLPGEPPYEIIDMIRETARRYGVPEDVAVAVARHESGGWNPDVIYGRRRGSSGEIGVFQLMPSTARALGVNPFDIAQNIEGGIRYLKLQHDRFGSWPLAIAAYNAGPGSVNAYLQGKQDLPSITKRYIRAVGDFLNRIRSEIAEEFGPALASIVGERVPAPRTQERATVRDLIRFATETAAFIGLEAIVPEVALPAAIARLIGPARAAWISADVLRPFLVGAAFGTLSGAGRAYHGTAPVAQIPESALREGAAVVAGNQFWRLVVAPVIRAVARRLGIPVGEVAQSVAREVASESQARNIPPSQALTEWLNRQPETKEVTRSIVETVRGPAREPVRQVAQISPENVQLAQRVMGNLEQIQDEITRLSSLPRTPEVSRRISELQDRWNYLSRVYRDLTGVDVGQPRIQSLDIPALPPPKPINRVSSNAQNRASQAVSGAVAAVQSGNIRREPIARIITDLMQSLPESYRADAQKALEWFQRNGLGNAVIAHPDDVLNFVFRNPVDHTPASRKLLENLRRLTALIREREALYARERSSRLGRAMRAAESAEGEARHMAALAQLRGEFPQITMEPLRGTRFTQEEIDLLNEAIWFEPKLRGFAKIKAWNGLRKIMEGIVPDKSEIEELGRVFGDEVRNELTVLASRARSFEPGPLWLLTDIPRALITTFDMSAVIRQGILAGSVAPREWKKAFLDTFGAFARQEVAEAVKEEIASRPTFNLMRKYGLALTAFGVSPLEVEERYAYQRFLRGFRELGPIKASERHYTVFLTKLRADVFDELLRRAAGAGLVLDDKLIRDTAWFVNVLTGRGSLGELERAATWANKFFFAPRFVTSRIQYLTAAFHPGVHPFVRRQAALSLFNMMALHMTIAGLIKLARDLGIRKDISYGTNPRSADFMKVRIGNTRIELTGGVAQYPRLIAQIASNSMISTVTGREITFGTYGAPTRASLLTQFIISKSAPTITGAQELLSGKLFAGEPWDTKRFIASLTVPMFLMDFYDVLTTDHDLAEIILSAFFSWFGAGVQAYPERRR